MKWRIVIIYLQWSSANFCYWSSGPIKCNFIDFLLWVKKGICALFSKMLHVPLALFLLPYTLLMFESPDWKNIVHLLILSCLGIVFCRVLPRFAGFWQCGLCIARSVTITWLAVKLWGCETLALFVPFYLYFSQSIHLRGCLLSRLMCCGFCVAVSAKYKNCHLFISVSLSHLSPAFNFPLGSPFLSPLYGSNFNNPSSSRPLSPKKYFTVHTN